MASLTLTPRARAVARYLLGGWRPENIAAQLDISVRTVTRWYCSEIRKAVGQTNMVAAVMTILRDRAALQYVMEQECPGDEAPHSTPEGSLDRGTERTDGRILALVRDDLPGRRRMET